MNPASHHDVIGVTFEQALAEHAHCIPFFLLFYCSTLLSACTKGVPSLQIQKTTPHRTSPLFTSLNVYSGDCCSKKSAQPALPFVRGYALVYIVTTNKDTNLQPFSSIKYRQSQVTAAFISTSMYENTFADFAFLRIPQCWLWRDDVDLLIASSANCVEVLG